MFDIRYIVLYYNCLSLSF